MKHVTTTVKTRNESFLARATKSFALAAGAVVFCLLQASAADLVWYRTKAEAVAAAKASSKLIFLVNGRDTCRVPCVRPHGRKRSDIHMLASEAHVEDREEPHLGFANHVD